MKAYEWAFKKRKHLDLANGKVKNNLLKANKKVLGEEKELPPFAKISFSKNWKNKLK
jgi:L-lactate dehydrogenase complex protein LldF